MDTFAIDCPHCAKSLIVQSEKEKEDFICPSCRNIIEIQVDEPAPDASSTSASRVPIRPPAVPVAQHPGARTGRTSFAEYYSPIRGQYAGKITGVGFAGIGLGGLMILVSGVGFMDRNSDSGAANLFLLFCGAGNP